MRQRLRTHLATGMQNYGFLDPECLELYFKFKISNFKYKFRLNFSIVVECKNGSLFVTGESSIVLTCLDNYSWSLNSLPPCEGIVLNSEIMKELHKNAIFGENRWLDLLKEFSISNCLTTVHSRSNNTREGCKEEKIGTRCPIKVLQLRNGGCDSSLKTSLHYFGFFFFKESCQMCLEVTGKHFQHNSFKYSSFMLLLWGGYAVV